MDASVSPRGLDRILFLVGFLGLCTYLLWGIVLDYSKVWMHPELPGQFLPIVFENGKSLQWGDLPRIFDWQAICGGPRSRVLSTFFLILDGKLRQKLWEYLPLHPSLSITWLSALISLFLFYHFLRRYFGDRSIAWRGLLLYMASVGFLSIFAMTFHPGKPLAVFVILLSLFIASYVFPRWNEKPLVLYWALLATLFVGFFVDETAWFAFLLIPALYPEPFLKRDRRLLFTFPLPLVVGLLVITFVFPLVSERLGYGGFPFWKYALEDNKHVGGFHYHRYFQNVYLVFRAQFFNTTYQAVDFLGNTTLFVYVVAAWRTLSPGLRTLFQRLLIGVGLYVVFQTLLMTRHLSLLKSPYYYGGCSSLLMALCLSVLLSSEVGRWRVCHRLVFFTLLPVLLLNFENTNRKWQTEHVNFYRVWFPAITQTMKPEGEFSRGQVRDLWNHRGNPDYLKAQIVRTPIIHLSVIWELLQTRRSWKPLSEVEVAVRFGTRPFDYKLFKGGSPKLRGSMASSLLEQPSLKETHSEDVERLLGQTSSHCLREGTIAYDIEAACGVNQEKLKIVFLLSSENIEHTRKVRRIAVLSDCCENPPRPPGPKDHLTALNR